MHTPDLPPPPDRRIQLRDGWVDLERRAVVRGETSTGLSRIELRLLSWLAARPGQVFSPAELLQQVWGYAPGVSSKTPAVTIRRLRTKIEADPNRPDHLLTAVGRGYRFAPANAEGAGDLRVVLARSNLLPEGNRFVGRAAELDAVEQQLTEAPLVTLLGPGGLGKTRLARRAAARLLERDPPAGGVWFCDLVTARDAGDILQAVAGVLDLHLSSRQPLDERIRQLGNGLAERGPCLVILDNLEQVLEPAQAMLPVWLTLAPAARWLATSRRPLCLPEESTVPLGALGDEAALALFTDRARAVRPGFSPGADAAQLTALLAEQLDGLPLAIELAASRASMLTAAQLIDRIDQRFRLLTTRTHLAGRHAALEATIDWSWALLTEAECDLFARCGVFAGPFDDADAAAVLGPSARALPALAEHSLIVREGERWRLLESLRVYAGERLAQREALAATVDAHGEHYAALGERCSAALRGPDARSATAALERSRAELQLALGRAERTPERAARLALALDAAHEWRGRIADRLACLELGLAGRERLTAEPVVELLRRRADTLRWLGSVEAEPTLDEAIALARASGADAALARALGNRVALLLSRSELEAAVTLAEEALGLHRAVGARWYEALTHYHLSIAAHYSNDHPTSAHHTEVATALFRALGDRLMEGQGLLRSAITMLRCAQPEQARALLEQGLALARALDNPELLGDMLYQQGHLALAAGDLDDAERYYQEFADWASAAGRLGLRRMVAYSLAAVAMDRGDLDEARATVEATAPAPREPSASMRPFLLGVIARLRGDSADAVRWLRESEALCEENQSARQSVWLHLGPALADIGALAEAEAVSARSVAWRDAHGTREDGRAINVALAHLDLARERAALAAGDAEGAAAHAAARRRKVEVATPLASESADLARMLKALAVQVQRSP